MDFFKFIPTDTPGNETILLEGQLINNLAGSMWVERYADPGEFAFAAKLSSGLREFLPIGTLVSHANTLEVMIVENHEIQESMETDPVITITGRSLVSFLENRIIGMNFAISDTTLLPYVIAADNTWDQITLLINQHIVVVGDPDDSLPNVRAVTAVTGTGESIERTFARGPVLDQVLDLLRVDDLGIKTIRRNTFGVEGSDAETQLEIYKGENKSSTVMFSWKSGELDSANYLFTQKNVKNSALVVGQYLNVIVNGPEANYNRKTMVVDGTDIDGHYGELPLFADYIAAVAAMTTRGQQFLRKQNWLEITQSDISKTTRYQYRRDYNLGDLVSLDGNYNIISIMRVTEYAEIEDENGESGHPTLALFLPFE